MSRGRAPSTTADTSALAIGSVPSASSVPSPARGAGLCLRPQRVGRFETHHRSSCSRRELLGGGSSSSVP